MPIDLGWNGRYVAEDRIDLRLATVADDADGVDGNSGPASVDPGGMRRHRLGRVSEKIGAGSGPGSARRPRLRQRGGPGGGQPRTNRGVQPQILRNLEDSRIHRCVARRLPVARVGSRPTEESGEFSEDGGGG